MNTKAKEVKDLVTKSDIKKLNKAWSLFEDAHAILDELKEKYESIAEEMRDYYDDRSEAWQESEKGEAWNELTEQIEDFVYRIEECRDNADNSSYEIDNNIISDYDLYND